MSRVFILLNEVFWPVKISLGFRKYPIFYLLRENYSKTLFCALKDSKSSKKVLNSINCLQLRRKDEPKFLLNLITVKIRETCLEWKKKHFEWKSLEMRRCQMLNILHWKHFTIALRSYGETSLLRLPRNMEILKASPFLIYFGKMIVR